MPEKCLPLHEETKPSRNFSGSDGMQTFLLVYSCNKCIHFSERVKGAEPDCSSARKLRRKPREIGELDRASETWSKGRSSRIYATRDLVVNISCCVASFASPFLPQITFEPLLPHRTSSTTDKVSNCCTLIILFTNQFAIAFVVRSKYGILIFPIPACSTSRSRAMTHPTARRSRTVDRSGCDRQSGQTPAPESPAPLDDRLRYTTQSN